MKTEQDRVRRTQMKIIATATMIGVGMGDKERLQRRLNHMLAQWGYQRRTPVRFPMKAWTPNRNPRLP